MSLLPATPSVGARRAWSGLALLLVACGPRAAGEKETGVSVDTVDSTLADTSDSATDTGTSPWADPCTTYTTPIQTGEVADAELDELSGIAVSRRNPDVLWVHEDHLGANAIYALDTTGATLATVTLEGATNNDWEDLSIGPCGDDVCIFIGEVGNNDLSRTELGVYALVEPDLSTVADGALSTTDWSWYGLAYPGPNENAEALAVTADGLPVVLTKHYEGETSDVYLYPSLDPGSVATLTAVGVLTTGGAGTGGAAALTAADLWPDDSRLIFRTYGGMYELDLSGGLATIAAAPVTTLAGAPEPHGEAIAYDPWRGGFWQVAEGVNTPLWFTGCAM